MKTFCNKTYCVLLFFMVLIASVSCSKDDDSNSVEEVEADAITEEILQLVNEHRKSIGKEALSFNALANTLAYDHTLYMVDKKGISHDGFDERADRFFAEENASGVGENVAYRQKSAQEVMNAWLNSPGHRKNIEGDFTHIGIAAVKDSEGNYYFTQLFLKKRSTTSV